MDTELQKVKSDAKVASAIVIGALLTDYLRIRLHEWCKLDQPLAFALGIFLGWTMPMLIFGPGRVSKRTYMIVLTLLSLTAYVLGKRLHF
jgi:hypothetical protein